MKCSGHWRSSVAYSLTFYRIGRAIVQVMPPSAEPGESSRHRVSKWCRHPSLAAQEAPRTHALAVAGTIAALAQPARKILASSPKEEDMPITNPVSTESSVPVAPEKKKRGFASMDRDQVREFARRGGVAAHRAGTAHEFNSNEAREAGRKGGLASHSPDKKSVPPV